MEIDIEKFIAELNNTVDEIIKRLQSNLNQEDLVMLLESTRARVIMDVISALQEATNKIG